MLTDLINERFDNEKDNYLIIDEAHNLPELAPSYLGVSVSYSDFSNLFNQLFFINQKQKLQSGILPTLRADVQKSSDLLDNKQKIVFSDLDVLEGIIDEYKVSFSEIFTAIGENVVEKGSYGKLRIKALTPELINGIKVLSEGTLTLQTKIQSLHDYIESISSNQLVNRDDHLERLIGSIDKLSELSLALKYFDNVDSGNNVVWTSTFSSVDAQPATGTINLAPLDFSEIMLKTLYEVIDTIVFSSATLSLRGNFKYFNKRMGLDLLKGKNHNELIIPSPFDYDVQTKVIAPSYLPNPTDRFHLPQSIELLLTTLKQNKGGSLVLFTSYKDLNAVYDKLSEDMYQNNILLLAQGKGASRTSTIREFIENGKGVLLGTSSFWEGVDVPGESLSLLIIYKLPFQVPTEPYVEALHEKIEREGKNPFQASTLPNAMLKFRQGFGRLIRKKSDRGIVLILDNRLFTKKYGEYFHDITPTKIIEVKAPIEVKSIVGKWFSPLG
jgi:ATP-dependent DNA helicase DinG